MCRIIDPEITTVYKITIVEQEVEEVIEENTEAVEEEVSEEMDDIVSYLTYDDNIPFDLEDMNISSTEEECRGVVPTDDNFDEVFGVVQYTVEISTSD